MPSIATAGRTSFLPFAFSSATTGAAIKQVIPLFQAFSPLPVRGSTCCDCIKVGRKIEQTAKGILEARSLYPNASLADLYDPLTMPPELQKAHTENDRAVMRAYGFDIKAMTEADCVAALMKMYQDKVNELKMK